MASKVGRHGVGGEKCVKLGGCPRCTPVPGKTADPQSSPKPLPHLAALLTTTHWLPALWEPPILMNFRGVKLFMIRSVSCFCQLFYPPNQSTPSIIILKILHSFTWDAYLHPSCHDFHMKVRPGQRKRFSSHRTLHHLPSPSLLSPLPNFSLHVFSPGTGSRPHRW